MSQRSHQKIHFGILILIATIYPFSLKLCNAAILLLAFHWIVWLLTRPKHFEWKNRFIWLLLSLYGVTALSTLYSKNLDVAIFALDKKIALIIFPLVTGTQPITATQFRRLIFFGIAAVLVAVIFCLLVASHKAQQGVPHAFFWKELTAPLGDFHPTYFSLYINFLIAWLAIYLIEDWKKKPLIHKLPVVATLILFYVFLVLLASKIHLLLAGIIPLVVAMCYMRKNTLKVFVPCFLSFFLVVALIIKQTRTWERFQHIKSFSYELNDPVSTFNEFTIRLALFECSWQVIQENIVLGVGVGDVYDELEQVYRKVDYKFGYLDQQNPHNEYLSQWLATGLFGLLLMLGVLTGLILIALRTARCDFLILLFLFVATFSIESVLERQKGIVLFSLLISLYAFTPVQKKI